MTRFVRNGIAAAIALVAALAVASSALALSPEARTVLVKDKCDAATFNAVVGPGTCVGDFGVTFSDFVSQLTASQQAGGWRFAPGQLSLPSGTDLIVTNVGGEFHTFTKVAQFGPGFVPFLNLLVFGVPGPPQPEFLQPFNTTTNLALEAGATRTLSLGPGTNRFECGIHPWMQTTVEVG